MKPIKLKHSFLGLLAALFLPSTYAIESIDIPHFKQRAVIDGDLSDPVWQKAVKVDINVVYNPYENIPSDLNTYALVYESGDTLFVAFVADDPAPEQIRARYRNRDDGKGDDHVGIRIDPHGDGRLSYRFFVNPLGVQSDAVRNEITRKDNRDWDAIWDAAGQITHKGYQVEIALPLNVMTFSEYDGTKYWKAAFDRIYPREEKLFISNMPKDRNNTCDTCQFGPIEGFENAKQANNLFVVPSVVLGKSESRDVYVSDEWESENKAEPSVYVNWGMTPEISLQATLNPDFSQVEADDAKLSINNNFALFFPEKRPFFLENQEYFNTTMNLAYTRNIQSPDYGVKLAGRKDSHTFGVFVVDDQTTTFVIPGNLGSSVAELDEASTNLVGRYRYDADNGMSIGYVTTQRHSDNYNNAVHSADVKYEWNRYNELNAQIATSSTDYPLGFHNRFCVDDVCSTTADYSEAAVRTERTDTLTGESWKVFYNHNRRDWFIRAVAMDADADFRADMGFEFIVDSSKYIFGGGYNWYSEHSWWNKITAYSDFDIAYDNAGDVLEQEGEGRISVWARYQSEFTLGYEDRQRRGLRQDMTSLAIQGNAELFDETALYFHGGFSPNENLNIGTFIQQGDKIDYANNRLGEEFVIHPKVDWRIGKHIQLEVSYNRTQLDAEGQNLFLAKLTDLRATYQFDSRQFLRLIAIHSDITRNQANYVDDVDEHSRNLAMQLLYSYKLNPLTKFYVGYSEAEFSDDVFTMMTPTDKSVFMKLSYAWQPL